MTKPANGAETPKPGPEPERILRRLVVPAVTVLLLALAWFAVRRLAADVSYENLQAAIASVPATTLLAALALTALSFAALTVYDLGALAFVGRQLPLPIVALTSFSAYAVGNTVGFGALTAGAIRYRFYTSQGIEPEEIGGIVAFVTVSFGLGLAGVAGLGMLAAAGEFAHLPLPPTSIEWIGATLVLSLAALVLAAGDGRSVRLFAREWLLPSRRLMLRQTLPQVGHLATALRRASPRPGTAGPGAMPSIPRPGFARPSIRW